MAELVAHSAEDRAYPMREVIERNRSGKKTVGQMLLKEDQYRVYMLRWINIHKEAYQLEFVTRESRYQVRHAIAKQNDQCDTVVKVSKCPSSMSWGLTKEKIIPKQREGRSTFGLYLQRLSAMTPSVS